VPRHAAQWHRWAGGRQYHQHDEQGSEEQQQPILQLEPALVFPRGGDEVAYRGKHHSGRLTARQQVQQNGDGRRSQAGEHPRMEKADHAEREGGANASRSTTPKGVSVVI
jgi:hypothetical protein